MRLLFGIILGALLTIGATYLYDCHNAVAAENKTAATQRPLVNWDVVSTKWQSLTEHARDEWNRHVASR
jgi:hypothetical protein